MADTDEIAVVISEEDLDYARAVAAENGVQVEEVPAAGFEPVITVTLILLGATTAVGVVAQLLEQHKGGQVIDLRPGAPRTVYRSRDLIYGYVVIHRADGTITVDVKQPKGMFEQVLEALTGVLGTLGSESLKAAESTVKAAVGDSAAVTVEPKTSA